MDFVNDLGIYENLADVWKEYPSGGLKGDFVTVHGIRYGWNALTHQWETPDVITSAGIQTRRIDGSLSVARDVYIGGVLYCRSERYHCKGLFTTEEELKAAWPEPEPGDWAIVGSTVPGEIYVCRKQGVWTPTGRTGGGEQIDLTEYAKRVELQKAYNELLAYINGMYRNFGIVKSYTSVEEMNRDRHPQNEHGEPLREGAQAVITGTGEDHNKVYRWNDPGWTYLYTISTPDLSALWQMIYKLHALVTLSVQPAIIEKGIDNRIKLSWSMEIGDDTIKDYSSFSLKNGDTELKDADPDNGSLTLDNITDTGNYLLSVGLPYDVTKSATATVRAYYPVFIGSSPKAESAITSADVLGFVKQSIRSTPAGTYSMTVQQDDEYIYICIPEGMKINSATMGGAPMTLGETVPVIAVEGKGNYLIYRSGLTQSGGEKKFTIY